MRSMCVILMFLSMPALLLADDCCDCKCDHCGCQAPCQKFCRVVCEMKDVKVTCYCCKPEDICIPGHSEKCGEVCEPNPCCLAHPAECDACAGGECGHHDCDHCRHRHMFLDCLFGHNNCESRTLWEPSCSGQSRTINKLIKYEVSKKIPTYKWVVEYRCNKCCNTAEDQAPAPPVALQEDTKRIYDEIPNAAAPVSMPKSFTPPENAKPAAQAGAPKVADAELPWE